MGVERHWASSWACFGPFCRLGLRWAPFLDHEPLGRRGSGPRVVLDWTLDFGDCHFRDGFLQKIVVVPDSLKFPPDIPRGQDTVADVWLVEGKEEAVVETVDTLKKDFLLLVVRTCSLDEIPQKTGLRVENSLPLKVGERHCSFFFCKGREMGKRKDIVNWGRSKASWRF